MKLSKTQAELLAYMQGGGRVNFMDGVHSYYYRVDTYRLVSPTATALMDKGLATQIKVGPYRIKGIELTQAGKEFSQ